MSLFQCAKCGCVENTATTECSYGSWSMNMDFKKKDKSYKALCSYKDILGIPYKEEFPFLCCVCSPVWFVNGEYGVGKPPIANKWHNEFPRDFLPIGEYKTCSVGNLEHKVTGKSPTKEDYIKVD